MNLISRRYLFSFLTSLTIFFLDQLTKAIVSNTLPINIPQPLLGNVLQLTYIRNPNAAFGISFGRFALPFAILAILILIVLFMTYRHESLRERISIGLILGGAFGNLMDRIRWGEVVDFIDVGIHRYRWPVFNIADSAVTVGIFFLLIGATLKKRERQKKAESPEASC